jgi:transcriptional regulator with XRE-family HTH domain
VAKPSAAAGQGHLDISPLRRARLAKSLTLEGVCAELDQRANGNSGVTPSMLSAWELGRHATRVKFRTRLADYYGQPVEALFAHQDRQLTTAAETPSLLVSHHNLRNVMADVVRGARTYLACWDPDPGTRRTSTPSRRS